ncbi:mite allergen Der f 3 [Andrena cerasifolii]|uniref:mite allergen Der f 3 n=1 Tax=Andrena cerasifolii TaxID=2819439 RepID=UPI004037E2CB
MAFRLNVLAIFLLFTVAFVLSSAKSAGNLKKNKPGPAKLSDNISKNPFLQSTAENINNNLFLDNRTTTVTANGGNPFLSYTSKPTWSLPNSDSNQNQASSVDDTTVVADRNVAFSNHNPFLQATFNAFWNSSSINLSRSKKQLSSLDNLHYETTSDTNIKSKSELMCERYEKEMVRTTDISPLSGAVVQDFKVESQICTRENQLVVGGTIASPGEFPHMVALGSRTTEGTFTLICGGTLISPVWVLTAAHCITGSNLTDARVGFHDLRDNHGIKALITDLKYHPDYKPPANYADIGVVKLNTVIKFDQNIRPACLYQSFDTVPPKGWVSGWGHIKFYEGDISNQLLKAELDIIDNLSCLIKHGNSSRLPYGISPSMICAGDPRGGWKKDTCQGDSGGPLQIIASNTSCLYEVIGVTSFGIGCASVDIPGVYTRVSHYLNWIEDIVWP